MYAGRVLSTFAACLSLAAAIPVLPEPIERQLQPEYPHNLMHVHPPNVTSLTRPNPQYTTQQLNQIKLAYSEVERLTLLKSYGDPNDYFKFDLTPNGSHSNAANGLGGQGYLAYSGNYPALLGTGISVALGFLNPCGLDSIHLHNRATEVVTLVSGVSLRTGFVLEDGFGKPPYLPLVYSQTLTALKTCQSKPRSASTRALFAHKARCIGSSTTTACLPSLLPLSPMMTPVSPAQLRTSSSIHKRLLMPISHTQVG